jgi:hypothetical protein
VPYGCRTRRRASENPGGGLRGSVLPQLMLGGPVDVLEDLTVREPSDQEARRNTNLRNFLDTLALKRKRFELAAQSQVAR